MNQEDDTLIDTDFNYELQGQVFSKEKSNITKFYYEQQEDFSKQQNTTQEQFQIELEEQDLQIAQIQNLNNFQSLKQENRKEEQYSRTLTQEELSNDAPIKNFIDNQKQVQRQTLNGFDKTTAQKYQTTEKKQSEVNGINKIINQFEEEEKINNNTQQQNTQNLQKDSTQTEEINLKISENIEELRAYKNQKQLNKSKSKDQEQIGFYQVQNGKILNLQLSDEKQIEKQLSSQEDLQSKTINNNSLKDSISSFSLKKMNINSEIVNICQLKKNS